MLEVLEWPVHAEGLNLVAVRHGRSDFDHVLDGRPVEVGRRTEDSKPCPVQHLKQSVLVSDFSGLFSIFCPLVRRLHAQTNNPCAVRGC